MPVYNAEKYLSQAIESMLSQTFEHFEFLIINDGSTDRSDEIIRSYNDPRIRYIKNDLNKRISSALNQGIHLAKGKYIARMDSDDISLPNRLEKQLNYMEANPSVDAVFSCIKVMNKFGKIQSQNYGYKGAKTNNEIHSLLPKTNCLPHPTAFIKTEILKEYLYRPNIKSEDWDLWLRMISDNRKIERLEAPLLHYRMHDDSLSHQQNLGSTIPVITDLSKFVFFQVKKGKIGWIEFSALRTIFMKFFFSLPLIFSMVFGGFFGTLSRLWTLSRTSWDDTIILFFSNYGWAGAEVVHLEITRQLYRHNRVFIIFQLPYEKEPNYRQEFIKHSAGICVLQKENIYKRIIWRYIRFKLKHIPKTTLFGSYSYIFYRVIESAKKHRVIDLIHAFDSNYELSALPVIPALDQRIIISESLRGKLHKLYEQRGIDTKYMDRVTCIPNGIPVNDTYPAGKDFNRLNLLYVGRDAPEKRLYLIKKILEKLIKNGVDFSFTAVGGDFKLFKSFDHLPQVRCLGILKRTDLKEIYYQANIILTTSSREGFPMVMMEAMAEGIIPVSTDVGGIPDNITHMENGVLISDDLNEDVIVENFYKNLVMLNSEKSKLNQFSKAAFQYAKDNFSIEKFNERYDLLFDGVVGNENSN